MSIRPANKLPFTLKRRLGREHLRVAKIVAREEDINHLIIPHVMREFCKITWKFIPGSCYKNQAGSMAEKRKDKLSTYSTVISPEIPQLISYFSTCSGIAVAKCLVLWTGHFFVVARANIGSIPILRPYPYRQRISFFKCDAVMMCIRVRLLYKLGTLNVLVRYFQQHRASICVLLIQVSRLMFGSLSKNFIKMRVA